MVVRTESSTTFDLTGPNTYFRKTGVTEKPHQCLAWGAVVPMQGQMAAGQAIQMVLQVKPGAGVPVRIQVGKVMVGAPLGFVITDANGMLQVMVSTTVVEVEGQIPTPEGMASELSPELKKLLDPSE